MAQRRKVKVCFASSRTGWYESLAMAARTPEEDCRTAMNVRIVVASSPRGFQESGHMGLPTGIQSTRPLPSGTDSFLKVIRSVQPQGRWREWNLAKRGYQWAVGAI